MKSVLVLSLTVFLSYKAVACPGVGNWNSGHMMGPGNMGNMMNQMHKGQNNGKWMMGCQMSMIRHHYYMQNGIPSEYANLSNPLTVNEQVLEAGKKIYQQNCMTCHGQTGSGEGDAGKNLDPKPADIATFSKMPMATDSYLFWTISDGGTKLNTAMPSFSKSLSKEDIWSVISYIRKL